MWAQATAQPVEVKGEQATNGQQGECAKNVVVTAAGKPTCVPTSVDAGLSYDELVWQLNNSTSDEGVAA